MDGFVFLAALCGFDFDRDDIPCGEVVGAGAHIEVAEIAGEMESFQEEVGTDPRHGFGGPFVEIHVGVDASGLFVEVAGIEGGLDAVERFGGGGEKAEGIVMGAGDGTGFYEEIDFILWEAKGSDGGMTDVFSTINHGPFVHAVAGEVWWAVAGGGE